MGHYWSEMQDDRPPTELELLQARAKKLAAKLRELPADRFSVNELGLLLRINWSNWKHDYWRTECEEICAIAARLGVEA